MGLLMKRDKSYQGCTDRGRPFGRLQPPSPFFIDTYFLPDTILETGPLYSS